MPLVAFLMVTQLYYLQHTFWCPWRIFSITSGSSGSCENSSWTLECCSHQSCCILGTKRAERIDFMLYPWHMNADVEAVCTDDLGPERGEMMKFQRCWRP
ncbi:hypothetical protein K470DRAFT_96362 [Piedraia hortae CBS 480.64]|uniref:Uncharacterized protein n=1 Tax=Piedraia hortae CBS 480.64 TaxID=1314780 RepID=A0A6A7BWY2_9PEZI|nr:hypothetical protein K470DRAFT_96362 [Piedraia hortae CBS 480.64]